MIYGKKTLVCVSISLVLVIGETAIFADAPGNPYVGIVDRNVFSLKPPPPPTSDNPTPTTPPSKMTLTGITTILGKKLALLSAKVPPKPPAPAKDESYMLAEGQRDGEIEVISIDEKSGVVKVNNHGIPETLDFTNNAATLVNAPPPIAPPPGPGAIAQMRLPTLPGVGAGGQRAIPTRMLRSPPGSSASPTAPGYAGGMTLGGPQSVVPSQFHPTVTPEEQTIMIEAQRLELQQKGDPTAQILPTTVLTPDTESGSGGTTAPSPF